MYELKFEDKVKVWKDLREDLETSSKPFYLLSKFIKNLPRSTRKQNPWDPESVILPWHLIENNSFTEYDIALLSAYTLQLTDRFSDAKVEIHISKDIDKEVNLNAKTKLLNNIVENLYMRVRYRNNSHNRKSMKK